MTDTALRLIQDVLNRAVDRGEVAGANLLVIHKGRERWYAEAGMRNIARNQPMTRDTLFRMYSMTKPLTAAAAMMLVERGVLDLEAPVYEYLPGFANQRVTKRYAEEIVAGVPTESIGTDGLAPGDGEDTAPVKRDVCVKDLLTMTAGCVYPNQTYEAGRLAGAFFGEVDARLRAGDPMGTVEFANLVGRLPLAFQPGEHFEYGTCADVVGAIVEVASGRRFGDFMREEIFEPLGMKDTRFFVKEQDLPRLAAAYDNPTNPMFPERASADGGLVEAVNNHLGVPYAATEDPAFQSGGAGLRSTLDDYARFARMMLGGGEVDGVRLLQPLTVASMTTSALFENHRRDIRDWMPGYGYNCFMRILEDPGKARALARRGEYGWDGWLGTYWSNSPAADTVFLLGTQVTNSGTLPIVRKLKNIVNAYVE